MNDNRYTQFSSKSWELRDYLALERTILANERSVLAYYRTGLTTFIAGVSAVKLFTSSVITYIGIFLCLTGIIIMVYGFRRFTKVKTRLDEASPGRTADETAQKISQTALVHSEDKK